MAVSAEIFWACGLRSHDGRAFKALVAGDPDQPAVAIVNAFGMPADLVTLLAARPVRQFYVLT